MRNEAQFFENSRQIADQLQAIKLAELLNHATFGAVDQAFFQRIDGLACLIESDATDGISERCLQSLSLEHIGDLLSRRVMFLEDLFADSMDPCCPTALEICSFAAGQGIKIVVARRLREFCKR